MAFENYAMIRMEGRNPAQADIQAALEDSGLPDLVGPKGVERWTTILTAFEKLFDFLQRVKNLAIGRGFTSVDDLFERAFSGRLARNRAFDSALEYLTPSQKQRQRLIDKWMETDRAPMGEIDRKLNDLDTQINALKTKAMAGGC